MDSPQSSLNTESALSGISTWRLRKEIILFSILNSPKLNRISQKIVSFFIKRLNPFKPLAIWILKRTVMRQFCGGETISDCRKVISELNKMKVSTILDYSREDGDESTYDDTVQEILKTIFEARNDHRISFAVFKFSGITSKELLERASNGTLSDEDNRKLLELKGRVNRLCNAAFEGNVRILVDAEHSWIQPAIDKITEEMMLKYNRTRFVVYNTIQLYRHDRLKYFQSLHLNLTKAGVKTAVKLVRGAYMDVEMARAEKEKINSPIQNSKNETDRDFNLALSYFIDNMETIAVCIGTHNQTSIEYLLNLLAEGSVKSDDSRIFFAQLLGMADDLSFSLGSRGYNTAKYVPFAKADQVMPYLFRRADENKSIAGEMSRELNIRKNEIKRRKRKKK